MSSEKLISLVNLWGEFEKKNPEGGIMEFCRYCLQKEQLAGDSKQRLELQGKMGKMLGKLYRFAVFYSKKGLGKVRAKNLDNFIYLASIRELGSPRKSDLIQHCQSEFTSGIGIINRLLQKKWINEQTDPEDARTKRVMLTPEGMAVLGECFPQMAKIGTMVFYPFSEEEIQMFLQLGKKLDDLHSEIYRDAKDKSMDELIAMADKKLKG